MEKQIQHFPLSTREIILVIINLFSLVFLIVLLVKLPAAAESLRQARIISTKDDATVSYEYNQAVSHKPDFDKLSALFLDDRGVISFVNEVETLKSEENAIQRVTFTSQKPVKDRTGNFGIPVVIEMTGTWEQIGKGLEKIQVLPFLFRPVTFESKPSVSNPVTFDVKYGVLLYISP